MKSIPAFRAALAATMIASGVAAFAQAPAPAASASPAPTSSGTQPAGAVPATASSAAPAAQPAAPATPQPASGAPSSGKARPPRGAQNGASGSPRGPQAGGTNAATSQAAGPDGSGKQYRRGNNYAPSNPDASPVLPGQAPKPTAGGKRKPQGGQGMARAFADVQTNEEFEAYSAKVKAVKTVDECKALMESTKKELEPRAAAEKKPLTVDPTEVCNRAKSRGRISG